MDWQGLVLFHALFSALQALQFRAIARNKVARHAALAINAIAFSALYVCGLIVLPVIGKATFGDFAHDAHMYVAAAALFVMALYFMYKGMVHLESATASVLGTSSALFVVLLANFFFDEHLTPRQSLGIVILVPCLWYVLLLAKRHRKKLFDFKNMSWARGAVFIIASSVFLALAHILEKDILQRSTVATYVAFGWLLQLACAWLLYIVFGRHAAHVFRNNKMIRSALQLGVLRAAAGLFFILALVKSDSVSLVTVIANFRIIIVAVLAGWLLNEREFYYRKLAAAALSVVALSIIFWN